MSTRAVSRSFFLGSVVAACCGLMGAVACSSSSGDGGDGNDCSDGQVFDEDEGICVDEASGGGGGETNAGGEGGGDEPGMAGEGGGEAPVGGNGGGGAPGGGSGGGGMVGASGGAGGTMMNMGGAMNMGGMPTSDAVCPKEGNCKVLAVGDGLAAGTGALPGFLKLTVDFLKMAPRNKSGIEWVGSKMSTTFKHEGVNDTTSTMLNGTIDGIMRATMPHIVVLAVGSEDVEANAQAGLADRMKQIRDKIRAVSPNAYILILGLSRMPDSVNGDNRTASAFTTRADAAEKAIEAAIPAWNDKRARLVKLNFLPNFSTIDPAKPAPVDGRYFSMPNSYLPNAQGYGNIARLAVGAVLNQLLDH